MGPLIFFGGGGHRGIRYHYPMATPYTDITIMIYKNSGDIQRSIPVHDMTTSISRLPICDGETDVEQMQNINDTINQAQRNSQGISTVKRTKGILVEMKLRLCNYLYQDNIIHTLEYHCHYCSRYSTSGLISVKGFIPLANHSYIQCVTRNSHMQEYNKKTMAMTITISDKVYSVSDDTLNTSDWLGV